MTVQPEMVGQEPPERSGATGRGASLSVGDVFDGMRLHRAHIVAGSVLFIAFVIEAWEQVGLVYVSTGVADDFHIDNGRLGWALSAVALGMIPGALLWGAQIDRWGRKPVAVASLLSYAVIAALAGLAPNFPTFFVLRFLAGAAFGGVYAVTFPYFLELLPSRWRGQGAVALSIGFPIGTIACIGVSQAFGPISWRVVAVVAALAGLWAFAIMKWVPESPYWLAKTGRHSEATAVLRRLGARDLASDIEYVVDESPRGSIRALVGAGVRKDFLLILLVSFTFSWGYWGLQTWLPVLLSDRGLAMSSALSFVAISQLVSIPGYLLAATLTRRYGRRSIFFVFALASVIGGLVFAFATNNTQMYIGNLVLAFFSLGAWGIWNTWSGEILPTGLRGRGYSFATAAILGANSLAVPAIGAMMDNGYSSALTVSSIVAFLIVALICVLPLPETEGKRLD